MYPQLERRQRSPSTSLRILVGLICAAAAMLCAGGVEVHRLQLVRNNETIIQVYEGIRIDIAKFIGFILYS